MESQRSFLFIALAFVTYLLFVQWQQDYGPQPLPAQEQSQDLAATPTGDGPVASDIPQSDIPSASDIPTVNEQQLITVKTNVIELKIDTNGGKIVGGDLQKYLIEQGEEETVHLLSKHHQASSGLLGLKDNNGRTLNVLPFNSAKSEYIVTGNDPVSIPLTWSNGSGITVTKTITVKPDDYDIAVSHTINNNGNIRQPVQQFGQLKKLILNDDSSMMMPTYNGGAYSTVEEVYEKYDYSDMQDLDLLKTTMGGWAAMLQHYFVAAWVPNQTEQNKIYSDIATDGSAVIGFRGPVIYVEPGQSETVSSTLYAGPKTKENLVKLSESLELSVDYGPLWFISKALFALMVFIYQNIFANWGVAIILTTVVVKSAMYWLTKKQTVSMAKMRNLQPKLQALKEKYGDDRQKIGPAMMELYRKEKVNPMGGCLPLLMQMPIFLALYWMLLESVELRHAPFMLWITDLSTADPLYILPVLYGASMFLMTKITPTPTTDPMQQKMMMWMPVVFSVFFIIFPAGLVLYWLVNNIISILQTLYIYRQIDKKGLAEATAKAAK